MDREGQRALLVADGDRVGIFTGVDLTRAAVARAAAAGHAGARPRPLRPGGDRRGQLPVRGGPADGAQAGAPPRGAPRGRDRGRAGRRQCPLLAGQPGRPDRQPDRPCRRPGRARRSQRADRLPDPPAARQRHQDRLHHRALDRPAPARHRQAVRPAGAGRAGRACLPGGHGQRGPRRVPAPRPTRTTASSWPTAIEPPDWDGLPPALHRRHDRRRLSRLPGRDHGPQPGLVEAARSAGATTSAAGCCTRTSRR